MEPQNNPAQLDNGQNPGADGDNQYNEEPDQQDDGQEFDEMDLTPYEDDDDATLHRKLVAAKVARKRAEEDLKLLCNRIGLLKMEEGKVSWTKVLNKFSALTGGQKDR